MTSPTVQVQCCFTSTETVGTVRDGEPRTATSTLEPLTWRSTYTEIIRLIRDGEKGGKGVWRW